MPENEKLEDTLNALRKVLEQLSASNKPAEVDSRRHFYNMFNREADEYDRDFHKKYHDDLNTTLIFTGLFSAVASAFIVDIQQELRPDYNQMSFTVLTMLLNTTSGIPSQLDVPVASDPKVSAVQVQSILFGSLASALFAAFLAMLGKQWLNLNVEGSLIDRSRHRELRMRGMIAWRFKFIMECLPLVMQLSLLLLGYALARYVWDLSRTVSAVIAAFTIFGVLFYLFIVFAATTWKTCPFQTPVSLVLRHIISPIRKRQCPLLRDVKDRLSDMVHLRKLNESFTSATLIRSIDEELAQGTHTASGISIPAATTVDLEEGESTHASDTNCISIPAATMVDLEEGESTHTSDTNCISTMFRFAGASDAIVAVAGFISEVNWTSDVRRVPLQEVCRCLTRSFEFLKDGRVLVRPGMREQAYESARALLYLRVQRLCAGTTDGANVIGSKISALVGRRPKEDHGLESTLRVLDAVFNNEKEIPWNEFVFSDAHYCWLSHVLRCRAWAASPTRETLTQDVLGFVEHSLSKEPLPPSRVIADCLLIVDTIIGKLPELDDRMLIKDKSGEIEDTLHKIYRSLRLAVSPRPSASRRQRAMEVLRLVMHLKHEVLCAESYKLFLAIMDTVDSDDWLWGPAELSLIGAFKWKTTRPLVGDSASLLRFLAHCFSEEQGKGTVMDIPVERVMLALAGAPTEVINDGLARVDFTQPLFFNGICHALRDGAPYRLRRATVTFLRHLDAQLFNANGPLSEDQANTLVPRWSASAHESWETEQGAPLAEALLATLMGMLDSPFWREHIPQERWSILTLLGGMDEENMPPSFYRCVKNSTIIPHLKEAYDDGPNVLAQWIAVLWAKYPDLSEEVRLQLEETTKTVVNGPSKRNLSSYLSLVEGQAQQIWDRINSHASWSFREDVARLRERHSSLLFARGVLIGIQKFPI